MTALHPRRVDPARNMCRFYRFDVQPDLFGGVLIAAVALQRKADRKRRRGYAD
jgi:predicted DNA-binding WGR domain protein